MYYIEEIDNEVIKYEVKLDTEQLKYLRKEIVDNLSVIKHKDYETDGVPFSSFFTDNDVRNYEATRTGKYKEYFEEDRPIYRLKYDIYQHPKLANYIDMILEGNIKGLIKLLAHKDSYLKEEEKYRETLDDLNIEFEQELMKSSRNIDNINKLSRKIKKLRNKEYKARKNRKIEMSYYNEVMNCLTLTEVDRIDKDTIRKVEKFQGISYTKK